MEEWCRLWNLSSPIIHFVCKKWIMKRTKGVATIIIVSVDGWCTAFHSITHSLTLIIYIDGWSQSKFLWISTICMLIHSTYGLFSYEENCQCVTMSTTLWRHSKIREVNEKFLGRWFCWPTVLKAHFQLLIMENIACTIRLLTASLSIQSYPRRQWETTQNDCDKWQLALTTSRQRRWQRIHRPKWLAPP